MKVVKFLGVSMGIIMCSSGLNGQDLKTTLDSAAYMQGFQMGEWFFINQIDLNVDAFYAGAKDGITGKSAKMQEPQRTEVMNAFNEYVQKKQQEKVEREANFNALVAKSIFEQNRKNKDIKETASGLQYQVLKEGKGPKPVATDMVKVHYEGTFYDGRVFDSSVQRGEPAVFPLGNVIKGWIEGVQLMSVGSKYKFWIPAELAYGNNPIGNIPNSAGALLIFEVELFEINPQ